MTDKAERCSQTVLEENVLRLLSSPFVINVKSVKWTLLLQVPVVPFYNLHIKPFILCNELISLPSISPQTCKHLHRFIWLDPGLKYLSSYLLSSPNIKPLQHKTQSPCQHKSHNGLQLWCCTSGCGSLCGASKLKKHRISSCWMVKAIYLCLSKMSTHRGKL